MNVWDESVFEAPETQALTFEQKNQKAWDLEFGYNVIYLPSHLLTVGAMFLKEDRLLNHKWGGHWEAQIRKEKAQMIAQQPLFNLQEEEIKDFQNEATENVFGIDP